jgi:hypothetical protein
MIYLASPYSHPDPAVVEARFKAACKATAELMRRGKHVFSPIAHSHQVAVIGGLHLGWEFWQQIDFEWIRMCAAVYVLTLDGWEDSKGVTAEIVYAKSVQIPVWYLDPEEVGVKERT